MNSRIGMNSKLVFGIEEARDSPVFSRSAQAAQQTKSNVTLEGFQSQNDPQQLSQGSASFTLFACGLFAILGIVTTLLGPILPLLGLRWSISAAQAGTLFSWQFVSSTLGTLVGGIVLGRRSFRISTTLGVGLCLIGVTVLLRADWTAGRLAVAAYGLGLGIALPAINLAVAEANPLRRAASVSLLNFAWGIGAIGGPVLLRLTQSLNRFLLLTSILLMIGFIASFLCAMPARIKDSSEVAFFFAGARRMWSVAAVIALGMFLYCGVENAISGWASTLALPSFSNAYTATSANIAFWTFFLGSRALASALLKVFSETKLLLASVVCGSAGVLAFYFAQEPIAILVACGLAGLGIGPGFPLLISRVSQLIGSRHPAATLCFAFAGVGAAVIPTLMGLIGSHFTQPRAELLLPLCALLLMLPITLRMAFWRPRQRL
jgi:MFS transporter, FHS family, glucose/mannose:H+ symporter